MFIRQRMYLVFLLEPIDPFWRCIVTLHLTVSKKKRIGADISSRRGLRLLDCSHGRPLPAPPVQQGLGPCHHGGRV